MKQEPQEPLFWLEVCHWEQGTRGWSPCSTGCFWIYGYKTHKQSVTQTHKAIFCPSQLSAITTRLPTNSLSLI